MVNSGEEPQDISVLIVDDNVHYAKVLERMLRGALGFSLITAVDSPEAALQLFDEDPDRFRVLFVDYNFPSGKNGGQLLEELQRRHVLGHKTVFLMTSEPTPENMEQASRAGAQAVITKPFQTKQIQEHLKRIYRALDAEDEGSFTV